MARFEDFTPKERHVIREAMEWAQPEFFDPGHTKEDKDTLFRLIEEVKTKELAKPTPDHGPWVWVEGIRRVEGEPQVLVKPVTGTKAGGPLTYSDESPRNTEAVGGYDRGGHPIIRHRDGSTQPVGRRATEKPSRKSIDRPQLQPGEHTGFLYIECAHCGHIHAFCAKQPIRTYRCEECGERTPLIDMHPMRVACECGARFNYKTNIVTEQMDVTCYHCGAPVAVEWSDKQHKYQPIAYKGCKGHGKKKRGGRK